MTQCEVCSSIVRDGMPLCRNCATVIRGKIAEVPALIEAARADLALQQRFAQRAPVGKSSEHPAPVARRAVTEALRDADHALAHIESQVRAVAAADYTDRPTTPEQLQELRNARTTQVQRSLKHLDTLRGHRDPAQATEPTMAESSALWLHEHTHWLRRVPGAAAIHDVIDTIVETLRQAIDLPRQRKYRGPCQQCKADLWSHDDEDEITCDIRRGGCGKTHKTEDLSEFLIAQARPALVTAPEARTAILEWTGVDVPLATIRSWHHRGRIHPIAYRHKGKPAPVWIDREDPPLFRFGDILDLLTTRKPK